MKKLFVFLSAVLLSVAMQATVVTNEYDLSNLSAQQDSTTWSANTVTVKKGWDGIAHDYGDYPYDAEDYTEIVLELSSAASVGVNLWVTYSDNSTSNKTIEAGSLIARVALSSSAIKRIDVKLIAAGSATISKLYFSKVIGKETPTNLFTGTKTFNWNWEDRILIANTEFASIHEGDRIQFTYTSEASGQCQVRVQNLDDATNQLTETGEYAGITQSQAEPATFSFVLRAEDIEKIQANGLYFHGNDYTITSIDLFTYAQQIMLERVLNTGSETINWNQHWKHTDLPTLAAGDELHFTVSAVDGSNNYQLHFRHDDQADGDISFAGITTTVPYVYSHTLSADEATAINTAGKLWLVGTGITVSHFAVAQPMSIYDENLLWRGEEAAGDSWSTPVTLSADKFSGVEVGDILHVLLTELDAAGQLSLTQRNHAEFSVKPSFNLNSTCAAPMALSFVINQSMKDELQANGLFVSGKKFTVAAVYVIKAEAHAESYFLKVGNAEMATLVLPFNVPDLPAGVEAYRLTYDGSEAIEATPVSAIQADKPVLIIADANEDPGYEFVSELGADTCIFYKDTWSVGTYQDGALHGNYANEFRIPNKYEIESVMNYFYVLQNGASGVGFYQLQYWGDVKVNPYRAFLGCSLDLNGFGSEPSLVQGRRMRIVFRNDAPTGLENTQTSTIDSQKLLLNGQILIKRGNNTYNMLGQQL